MTLTPPDASRETKHGHRFPTIRWRVPLVRKGWPTRPLGTLRAAPTARKSWQDSGSPVVPQGDQRLSGLVVAKSTDRFAHRTSEARDLSIRPAYADAIARSGIDQALSGGLPTTSTGNRLAADLLPLRKARDDRHRSPGLGRLDAGQDPPPRRRARPARLRAAGPGRGDPRAAGRDGLAHRRAPRPEPRRRRADDRPAPGVPLPARRDPVRLRAPELRAQDPDRQARGLPAAAPAGRALRLPEPRRVAARPRGELARLHRAVLCGRFGAGCRAARALGRRRGGRRRRRRADRRDELGGAEHPRRRRAAGGDRAQRQRPLVRAHRRRGRRAPGAVARARRRLPALGVREPGPVVRGTGGRPRHRQAGGGAGQGAVDGPSGARALRDDEGQGPPARRGRRRRPDARRVAPPAPALPVPPGPPCSATRCSTWARAGPTSCA
ncbi:hypothetical protein Actkin_01892 [Actinokineospora sp. UTMC 2448]|nr:hypothetical protein Actkin_01892 [Actinokineospora sp. UTMC 2448]